MPFHNRANKLSSKSETIVYLGQPASYKGLCFYCITTGCIFIGATATFDETFFPCCPDGKQQHFTESGDQLPTENRYPDNPIDQSDENNFGNDPSFPPENDNHPPSSPLSEPEVPIVPDHDIEHSSHTQRNSPVPPPQWHNDDAPRHGTRQ